MLLTRPPRYASLVLWSELFGPTLSRGEVMFESLEWSGADDLGRPDEKARVYLCVASYNPEAIRAERWDVRCSSSLRGSLDRLKEVCASRELWAGGCVIVKRPTGAIEVRAFDFSPLYGWTDSFSQCVWGARVLISAILQIEKDGPDAPLPGQTWHAELDPALPSMARVTPEPKPSGVWPTLPLMRS